MPVRLLRYFALASLLLLAGCTSGGSGAPDPPSSEDIISSPQGRGGSSETVVPSHSEERESFALSLPRRGIFVATIRWGLTTLGVFDVANRALAPVATRETGELLISGSRDRLAYLVREGPNPRKNFVEVIDWRRRKSLAVKPASDFAILGFTLNPSGDRLSYAAMNLRKSRSHHVTWRAGLADLERYETRLSLESGPDKVLEEGIPVPFGWSRRREEIFFQIKLPLRGMVKQGIWAMKPDGSSWRQILPEASYTGVPRLSPDGASLAYFATSQELLPQGYIPAPGEPPANVLTVMNLMTGDKSVWTQKSGTAFGAFAWSPSGKEILVSEQEWSEGRFHDGGLLRVAKDKTQAVVGIGRSSPFVKVTDVLVCGDGSVFWVEELGAGARLRAMAARIPATLLTHPDGKIHLFSCLE